MKYALLCALQQVWNQRRVYCWVILELWVVVSILTYAYTVEQSGRDEANRLGDLYLTEQEYIAFYRVSETEASSDSEMKGITVADAEILTQEFAEEASFTFYIADFVTLYGNLYGPDTFGELHILFANPMFFEQYGIDTPETGGGWVGEEAARLLGKNPRILSDLAIAITPGGIALEGAEVSLRPFSSDAIVPRGTLGHQIALTNSLILPDSLRPEEWPQNNIGTVLAVSYSDIQTMPETRQKILNRLYEIHGDEYKYEYANVRTAFLANMTETFDEVELFGFIAGICLLIGAFGITGILFLFFQKRRKRYAIALALGASRWQLRAEAFWEVFAVNFLGCGAGFAVGCVLSAILPHFRYSLVIPSETPLLVLALAALLSLAVCMVTLPGVNNIRPVEVLKSE